MADPPSVTVAIPTRGRHSYLDVSLQSIVPQARALGAEVLVVIDGQDPRSAQLARQHGARTLELPEARGLNGARNAALAASEAEVVIFTDDDVLAPERWLSAYLDGIGAHPEADVLGGPIRPMLEGPIRGCGREPAPISALDEGTEDGDVAYVWGANMAVRRSATEKAGLFDEALRDRGDEEEWQDRLHAAGGRVIYLAQAGLEHRRDARDSGLARLALADYRIGRTARRNDVRKGKAPTPARELRDLAGALWHLVHRRCPFGLVFAAHAIGRLQETARPTASARGREPAQAGVPEAQDAAQDDFLSGESGFVSGPRARLRAAMTDAVADIAMLPWRRRLAAAAAVTPVRRVLVVAIARDDQPNLLQPALAEIRTSHHELTIATGTVGTAGKFENLSELIAGHDLASHDWLIALDDDVALPHRFLDEFLMLAERFDLALAQPAHRAYSHAAWSVTRRRPGMLIHETRFVEIGPLTAFHHRTFTTLLPFPPLTVGWGLDSHWAAVAQAHGWRLGVVDATPLTHALRPVASSYTHAAAIAEARQFLAGRPYLSARDANRLVATHRRL